MLSLETKLSPACPRELSVRNMVRRVLGIVREEAENAGLGPLFHAAMEASKTREEGPSRPAPSRPLLTSRTSFAASTQASVTSLFNTLSAHSPLLSAATTPDHSGMHTPVQQLPPGSPGAQRDIRPAVLQDPYRFLDEEWVKWHSTDPLADELYRLGQRGSRNLAGRGAGLRRADLPSAAG